MATQLLGVVACPCVHPIITQTQKRVEKTDIRVESRTKGKARIYKTKGRDVQLKQKILQTV
jgi:hypothetical protein